MGKACIPHVIPDFNQVLKPLRAGFSPHGSFPFLLISWLRLWCLGPDTRTRKEFRNRGIEAVMFAKCSVHQSGFKRMRPPDLDDNPPVQRLVELLRKTVQTLRIYQQDLPTSTA
jgi:hypothetical protein